MDITQPTGTQTAKATKPVAGLKDTTAADGGALASDFQTFLTLLTTQLKNQDPLKPMESTEFVAQLASFSSVEQQVRTNDRLEQILDALGGGSTGGLAAWIGKEVRAPAQANFTGVPIEIETTPLDGSDSAVLVVRNDFDEVVARRAIDAADATLSWDGKTELGATLPDGAYSFAVDSYAGADLIGSSPGQVFARVKEVRLEDGAAFLLLDGGGKVSIDDVTALR